MSIPQNTLRKPRPVTTLLGSADFQERLKHELGLTIHHQVSQTSVGHPLLYSFQQLVGGLPSLARLPGAKSAPINAQLAGTCRPQGVSKVVCPHTDFTRPMGSQIWPFGVGLTQKRRPPPTGYTWGRLNTQILVAVPLALTVNPHNSDIPWMSLAPLDVFKVFKNHRGIWRVSPTIEIPN